MKEPKVKESSEHYASQWKKNNWLTMDLETGVIDVRSSDIPVNQMTAREEKALGTTHLIPLRLKPTLFLKALMDPKSLLRGALKGLFLASPKDLERADDRIDDAIAYLALWGEKRFYWPFRFRAS